MLRICITFILLLAFGLLKAQQKAVLIILDGISADVLEQVSTPAIDAIAADGGYTRAFTGGTIGAYNQSPTISAPGYNHVLTGVWSNKHNVWDNNIKEPNYNYWNIFRAARHAKPQLRLAIFSTWQDNRTKLIGEGLAEAGNIHLDYVFDGFEKDEKQFPHDADRNYIFEIDEQVSKEAARYIREQAPDLSWVYLEYTDDVGHKFGDGREYKEAIRLADAQVGRVWEAVQYRQKNFNEDWMIVVTTDHGRDAQTGKNHGGQSERERTVWIATNAGNLNQRFGQGTAAVDIMPSFLRHLQIIVPGEVLRELDGVPFIGAISVANPAAMLIENGKIKLNWEGFYGKEKIRIFLSVTDNYKQGVYDKWVRLRRCASRPGKNECILDISRFPSSFYKILLEGRHNQVNIQIHNR
ncbi:MAG: alkaline phosphatase family protein [Cyclobacteriaceae bacterium]|nr:alkaline phosphatase family protein [Cyclobacteriaceae bacterium]